MTQLLSVNDKSHGKSNDMLDKTYTKRLQNHLDLSVFLNIQRLVLWNFYLPNKHHNTTEV